MKKPFCAAPWNYLHVRADQRFGACCISRMYYDPDTNNTFDEHWNSPEMKALRVTLMSGKPDPKICYRCLPENCNSTALSYKGYNEKAAPHLTEMMDKTLEDGTTTYFPRTFDFRTDLCNFKCRMCYDTFSSKIKTEHIKYGLETTPRGKVDSLEATGLTDDSISKLEYITWAGGEPFMSPVYWEVIDRLIELGNTDLKMFYYTNMSFPGKTIDRAVNTLCQFSRVFLSGSLDGTGEDVEYIREGVKYEEFVSNLKYLQCSLPLATFSISYTATSMGLHTLGETSLPQGAHHS
jgi:sulfatase maturation enzyme AslB (radical SAM superfamily)